MVGVAFLVDFMAVGFFFYSFGIFYPAMDADFEGGSFGIAMALSVSNIVSGIVAPLVGRALDRFPIRNVMLIGAGLVSAGFAALSQVTTLFQLYLVFGSFFALGMGMMGGMASAKLVANWFILQRGKALGRATMGVSLSGMVMPAVATWIIAEVGWRTGFLIYSAGTLIVVVPLVLRFVVTRPEDMGLRPDGLPPATNPGEAVHDEDISWSAREIIRSANFWMIAIPFALVFSSLSAILIHIIPYATDLGISGYRAGLILSVAAGCGVGGKLVFGTLVDRLDARTVVWISFGLQMIGLVILMNVTGYAMLLTGAAIFGFAMGGVVPLQGAVSGMAFGRQSFGQVMGLMRPAQVLLHAVGIPLMAWIHDTTGTFELAFQIALGVYGLAAILITGLRVSHPSVRANEAGLA